MKEKETKLNTIEKGLKVWGWTEVIAGIGVIALAGAASLGLILIGAGGIKLIITERQMKKSQST
jgi:hypothetical protein